MNALIRLCSIATVLLIGISSASARDFVYQGLHYTVRDEIDKTCNMAEGDISGIGINSATGFLTVPEQVSDGTSWYTVKAVGRNSFAGCETITGISLPNTVYYIESGAFENCTNLETVTLGNSLRTIGDIAFRLCFALKEVRLPDTVTSIGILCFQRCERLELVYLGSGLKDVSHKAFSGCIRLKTIQANCPVVGNWFESSNAVETFLAGDMVTTIEQGILKDRATLETVSLGRSVSSVGAEAFGGCDRISMVECLAPKPPTIAESTFSDACYSNASLMVRQASEPAYRQAPGWKRFFTDSSIDSVNGDDLSITVEGRTLLNPSAERLTVSTPAGQLLYAGQAERLSLPAGVVLITCGGRTVKALVE